MPLISQSIPNLIGGVSQQPPTLRRPSQCEDSLNVYNDPVKGVRKRSGSQYVSTMPNSGPIFYGAIDRDTGEKYVFTASADGVRVFDVDGSEKTVTAPGGFGYLSGTTDYKFITIADTTFIVNPTVTVEMDSTLSPESVYDGLINFRQIDYGTTFGVYPNSPGSIGAVYTAPTSGTISTEAAAVSISQQLDPQAQIDAVRVSNVVLYNEVTPGNLFGTVSRGENFMEVIKGVTDNFANLPSRAQDGVIVKIRQNPATSADDYYVKFQGDGNGFWVESIAPSIPYRFDPATMPHVLQRQADGTFIFQEYEWGERIAGDEETAPVPSFIGHTINNIFFERDRLGFLSDVNCILSESGNVTNFFRTTVATTVDSDPIDIAASGKRIEILKSSIGVKDGILLFSDEAQFLLHAGDADILSAETASIASISSYQSNTKVEPARVGDSILFATRRGGYSGMREYFYQSNRDFTQSASITEHIPAYIPEDMRFITGSSTENIVFVAGQTTGFLYVYQYLFDGEEKVISAWNRWRFGKAIVLFAHVFDDYLYVVLDRSNSLTLEKVALGNNDIIEPLPSEVCLDESQVTNGVPRVYDDITQRTKYTFSRLFRGENIVLISRDVKGDVNIQPGDVIPSANINNDGTNTFLSLPGNWADKEFIIGVTYSFLYEFTQPYINLSQADIEIEGRLQVRTYTVDLFQSGAVDFRVLYGTQNGTATGLYINDVVDWSQIIDMQTLETIGEDYGETYTLGRVFPGADFDNQLVLVDVAYRVPIMSRNMEFRLQVTSDGWQPVSMAKAQWEAMYHKRSRINA